MNKSVGYFLIKKDPTQPIVVFVDSGAPSQCPKPFIFSRLRGV